MTDRLLVTSTDGVEIALDAAGSKSKQAIVFLHGIAQSRAVWRSVLEGPLAASYRLLAVDMRGHGDSSAPEGADAYARGDRLGADLHAVLSTLKLSQPLVVAWSYGGVVVGEYLRHHGSEGLGGILFMAAAVKVGKPARALFGPGMMDHAKALLSEDAATYEAGARAFLASAAARPLGASAEENDRLLDAALREMLRVPARARRALLTRSEDYSPEITACRLPLATLHGTKDSVVLPQMSAEIEAYGADVAGARVDGVGHLPWLEASDAFLAAIEALSFRVR